MSAAPEAPPTGPTITARDRLGFAFFLVLALHAALILGIKLESTLPETKPALTVSLYATADTPTLVQETQPREDIDELAPEVQPQSQISNLANSESVPEKPLAQKRFNRDQLIGAIAKLQSEPQATFETSRTRRLEEPSTSKRISDAEAAYLAMWRRKCERIGRVNYPPGNVQGDLVMRVSILSSGQLDYVRIVRSSGSSLLDNAALQTVRQAAPYQPFSVDMRKAYDRLEFTRTWQYSKFGTDIDR
jgi:protein TonB